LLDVKNRVRDLSLRKNNLILPIFGYRFSLAQVTVTRRTLQLLTKRLFGTPDARS
jgi:hypothetical protein